MSPGNARGACPDCAGQLFKTANGGEGMLTSVPVGAPYVDLGASAADERSAEPGTFFDVSATMVVAGVADVDTSAPSKAPFTITCVGRAARAGSI